MTSGSKLLNIELKVRRVFRNRRSHLNNLLARRNRKRFSIRILAKSMPIRHHPRTPSTTTRLPIQVVLAVPMRLGTKPEKLIKKYWIDIISACLNKELPMRFSQKQ